MRSIFSCCAISVLALAACRTRPSSGDSAFDALVSAGPVIIPLGSGEERDPAVLDVYYRSIVAQMQQAIAERDADWLDMLLAQHDRDIAPDWARESMGNFHRIGRALRMEAWMEGRARLETRNGPPVLGELLACELKFDGTAPDAMRLPGDDESVAPTRFLVHVGFEDRDCLGARSGAEFEDILTLHQGVDLDGGRPLSVPFDIEPPPVRGCERVVDIRCELLPGARLLDGDAVPGHRLLLLRRRLQVYPRGIESVRADPLATLRVAIDSRDPRHFDHVWLASRLIAPGDRDTANELLIGAIRLGPQDLARVAGACLVEATGLDIPPTDRDGWLAWWQAQRRDHR